MVRKYEDYIHAYTNDDRFHVIHEMVNYSWIGMKNIYNIDMQ